jgi:hypothetical protein
VIRNVRKLFIDGLPVEQDKAPSIADHDTEANALLEKLALASELDSPSEDVLSVMNEVKAWLHKQPGADNTSTVSIV